MKTKCERTRTLYLCYFGLREPLVQTQVLPYLREIKKLDEVKVSLLTFEPDIHDKWTAEQIEAEKKKLSDEEIYWHCLPYHKRPSVPATVYDIFCGAWLVWRMLRREKIDVLHARVHIPALMGALANKFSRNKAKLLFDIRGFFPEEYTDAGIWKENGWIYPVVKRLEKWLLKESDGFVVLTEKARQILFPESTGTGFDKLGRPVEVIPCCVDLSRFEIANEVSRSETRKKLNIDHRIVIVYVGSFGGWYLTEEMIDFFCVARKQNKRIFALILTQRDKFLIESRLQENGFSRNDFWVDRIDSSEIPVYLSAADIALSFIKACYSKQSSSPTKIAEYLAGGVPIITNSGVGDVDELITKEGVGVLLEDFTDESYLEAFEKTIILMNDKDFNHKSKTCAKNRFDLENVGGAKYRRIYKKLLNG